MNDISSSVPGTVAIRLGDAGPELYVRASIGHGNPADGWDGAGDTPGAHTPVALDELVHQFTERSDYESFRLHIVDDQSAPTLHFDGSDEWEGLPEDFGEFDGRTNTKTLLRTAMIRAALEEQPLGTIVLFDSDEDPGDRNAAFRVETGWVSTTNSAAFFYDAGDNAIDLDTLTVIHTPA